MVRNDRLGYFSYPWDWNDPEAVRTELRKIPGRFWDEIQSILEPWPGGQPLNSCRWLRRLYGAFRRDAGLLGRRSPHRRVGNRVPEGRTGCRHCGGLVRYSRAIRHRLHRGFVRLRGHVRVTWAATTVGATAARFDIGSTRRGRAQGLHGRRQRDNPGKGEDVMSGTGWIPDWVRDPTTGRVTKTFVDLVREAFETIEIQTGYLESKTASDAFARLLAERGLDPADASDADAVQDFLRKQRERPRGHARRCEASEEDSGHACVPTRVPQEECDATGRRVRDQAVRQDEGQASVPRDPHERTAVADSDDCRGTRRRHGWRMDPDGVRPDGNHRMVRRTVGQRDEDDRPEQA